VLDLPISSRKLKTEWKNSFWLKQKLAFPHFFQLSDDVIEKRLPFWKIFFYYQVCIATSYLLTNFHGNEESRIRRRAQYAPPRGIEMKIYPGKFCYSSPSICKYLLF